MAPPSRVERWFPNRRYDAVADPKKNTITICRVEGQTRTEFWRRDGWERAFDLADDGKHLIVCYSGLNLPPLNYETSWAMLSFHKRGFVSGQSRIGSACGLAWALASGLPIPWAMVDHVVPLVAFTLVPR